MTDKQTDLCTAAELIELLRSIEHAIEALHAMAAYAVASYTALAEKEITGATSH
jgi:hypothetical protein